MRRLVILLTVALVGLGSACSSNDPPATFSPELRSDFLTACTDAVDDPEIVIEVCKCVFDKAQSQLSISVFASYEATLKNDATAPLPQPIVKMLANCVLEETGLQG